MNSINTFLSTGLNAAGNAFYAQTMSKNATEERSVANLTKKENEVAGGILDTLYGLFVKAIPQTMLTFVVTNQLHQHLIYIGATEGILSCSQIAARFLPAIPILIAAAPIIGFTQGLDGEKKDLGTLVNDGATGLQSGRAVQKIGQYLSRALELSYAALLISRIVQNDGRIGAVVGMATLVAGLVYRYDLLNKQLPSASTLLDHVFTWQPSAVTYVLGGSALVAGPTRPYALFLLFIQGMRDVVLAGGNAEKKEQVGNEAPAATTVKPARKK